MSTDLPAPDTLTGITGLDEITRGLPPNGLTILVGAPGTGKTVMAAQIAFGQAAQGRDVIFLSAFSEPQEKLLQHLAGFSWYSPDLVARRIHLVSIRSMLSETSEVPGRISAMLREYNRPLVIIDGYRGIRNMVGMRDAQEIMASLSARLPYHHASCIVCSEADPEDSNEYPELAAADCIIGLDNSRRGVQDYRVLRVIKLRGHGFLSGTHGLQISGDGVTVYPRIATILPNKEPELTGRRLGFGDPGLDAMVDGGIVEYNIAIVSGPSGSGKTTLGIQWLIEGLNTGEHGLLVTFRESRRELEAKCRGLGMDIDRCLESGEIQLLWTSPVEIDPDVLAHRIRDLVQTRPDIKRVVIDGITELESAGLRISNDSSYLPSLAELLWREGTTVLMLRDGSGEQDPTDASGTPIAKSRIALRRFEYEGQYYRGVRIVSMQTSDHAMDVREFCIEDGGIRVIDEGRQDAGFRAALGRSGTQHGDQ